MLWRLLATYFCKKSSGSKVGIASLRISSFLEKILPGRRYTLCSHPRLPRALPPPPPCPPQPQTGQPRLRQRHCSSWNGWRRRHWRRRAISDRDPIAASLRTGGRAVKTGAQAAEGAAAQRTRDGSQARLLCCCSSPSWSPARGTHVAISRVASCAHMRLDEGSDRHGVAMAASP